MAAQLDVAFPLYELEEDATLPPVDALATVEVEDPEYYRIRKLPAIGYYIREKSLEAKQLSFDDLK